MRIPYSIRRSPLAVLVAALLLSHTHAAFLPVEHVRSLLPRAMKGYSIAALYDAVKEFLQDQDAWDNDVPGTCVINLSTNAGVDCFCGVSCPGIDENIQTPKDGIWNVCYLNGEQVMEHPGLGKFSVQFTKAGGEDGNHEDGLHHPVIRLENLNNWEPIKVQDIIDSYPDDQKGGQLCEKNKLNWSTHITWTCGLPMKGKQAFGLSNIGPDAGDDYKYEKGTCSAHVVQYQKNELGNGNEYSFDVTVRDAAGVQIGSIQHEPINPKTMSLSVKSKLPWTLEIIVGLVDDDYVKMAYAGQVWTCDEEDGGGHECTLGNGDEHGYENGDREGDVKWQCT